MDLALATDDVAILLGNGDGTFRPEVDYGAGMTGPITTGDFNNDGKLDVIGATGSDVSVLLGNGDGTFGFPVNSPAGNPVIGLAVGDFNHDGKLDVAAIWTGLLCSLEKVMERSLPAQPIRLIPAQPPLPPAI